MGIWIFGAAVALTGALSYSELGASLPVTGGEYAYLTRAYGPLVGFLSGWSSLTVGFSAGIATGAVGFSAYLLDILSPQSQSESTVKLVALVFLWLITIVHLAGSEEGRWLQWSLTSLNLGAIMLFLAGAFTIGSGNWEHFKSPDFGQTPGFGSLVVCFIFVSYAYSGWNAASYIAGETIDPGRTIPRAMILGTVVVALVYIGLNAAYLFALPIEQLAQPPVLPVAKKAAAALFGPTSSDVITAILCLCMAGGVSGMIWAGPRVYYAMASDGLLPTLLTNTSRSTKTPQAAIIMQCAWSSLLILSGTFERLISYSGVVLATFNALTVAALIVLRRKAPNLPRPYRVPLYPWLPCLYIVLIAVVVIYSFIAQPMVSGLGLGTVLAGVPVYFLWTRRCVAVTRHD